EDVPAQQEFVIAKDSWVCDVIFLVVLRGFNAVIQLIGQQDIRRGWFSGLASGLRQASLRTTSGTDIAAMVVERRHDCESNPEPAQVQSKSPLSQATFAWRISIGESMSVFRCRGCESTDLREVIDLGEMPLAGGFLPYTAAIANEKRYSL